MEKLENLVSSLENKAKEVLKENPYYVFMVRYSDASSEHYGNEEEMKTIIKKINDKLSPSFVRGITPNQDLNNFINLPHYLSSEKVNTTMFPFFGRLNDPALSKKVVTLIYEDAYFKDKTQNFEFDAVGEYQNNDKKMTEFLAGIY